MDDRTNARDGVVPVSRRAVLQGSAATAAVVGMAGQAEAKLPSTPAGPVPAAPPPLTMEQVNVTVNGQAHSLTLDARTTLLDMLREHLRLTGTKKGCDHGQCGACTVLSDGQRINSCLSLAVMHDGGHVVTVEGLATRSNDGQEALHPMQAAFLEHDGYQCGYCTPGQICSAIGMLAEMKAGWPSWVTADLTATPTLTDTELRERMSGNICRCSAYPNIVDAIRAAQAADKGAIPA